METTPSSGELFINDIIMGKVGGKFRNKNEKNLRLQCLWRTPLAVVGIMIRSNDMLVDFSTLKEIISCGNALLLIDRFILKLKIYTLRHRLFLTVTEQFFVSYVQNPSDELG